MAWKNAAEARANLAPFYESFATGDLASLDRIFAAEWTDNTLPPGREPGLDGLKNAVRTLRQIVPDVRATVEDVRVDGEVAVVRIQFTGTNTGGLPGVPPRDQQVRFLAFDQHRMVDGRIIESWHLEDNLTLMKQLGAI